MFRMDPVQILEGSVNRYNLFMTCVTRAIEISDREFESVADDGKGFAAIVALGQRASGR